MENLFKVELAKTEKLKADIDKKRDELMVRNAIYKEFKEMLSYSLESGINLTDVRQYIYNKMEEL